MQSIYRHLPISLFLISGFIGTLPIQGWAQNSDEGAIKGLLQETFEALNTQDAQKFFSYFHPEASWYDAEGTLKKVDTNSQGLESAFSAGLKFNLQPQNVEVQFFDDAAVVTNLYAGTMTVPSGQEVEMENRSSSFWVKEDDRWKLVHYHDSPLTEVE